MCKTDVWKWILTPWQQPAQVNLEVEAGPTTTKSRNVDHGRRTHMTKEDGVCIRSGHWLARAASGTSGHRQIEECVGRTQTRATFTSTMPTKDSPRAPVLRDDVVRASTEEMSWYDMFEAHEGVTDETCFSRMARTSISRRETLSVWKYGVG